MHAKTHQYFTVFGLVDVADGEHEFEGCIEADLATLFHLVHVVITSDGINGLCRSQRTMYGAHVYVHVSV